FMNSSMGTDIYRRYLLRTLIYLRPAAAGDGEFVVIRDRTDRYFTNVFQSATEPRVGPDWDKAGRAVQVSGASWGKPSEKVAGQWEIPNVSCITVTNDEAYRHFPGPRKAHARAFLKVVWPESVKVTKIGGPGHELDILVDRRGPKSAGSALWRDIGIKDPTVSDRLAFGGFWRLILWPAGTSRTRTFLNVIEPTDSKVDRPHTIRLLKCPGAIAAQAGSNVVVFGEEHQPLAAAKVRTADQTTRILVADIPPGAACKVVAGKDATTTTQKASAAGLVVLTGLRLPAGETIEVTVEQPREEK
ncbi:MAG TPA: hypothetical protein VFJ30_09800, partial [Phycisphaerae bacterium]|nr:hypothetical protein [Phycisphaerae bacterium]